MKRAVLFMLCIATLLGCSEEKGRWYLVKSAARQACPDFGDIIHVGIDTVTYGDNLDYRISHFADNPRMLRALDSLKDASRDILDTPVAYTYTIQYDHVGNFVFVQIDDRNKVLMATRDRRELFLNPGRDIPGYFEVWDKFY